MSADAETKIGSGAPEAGHATWQPRIAAFVCRWCTYAGADLAGTSRLKYPPQIRIVKLPCTGRIDPLFLLRAFRMGADGILVSGCHPGDCHYTSGNYFARRRWTLFRELLDYVGLEPERVHFSWVSAAEGAKFVDVVKKVTESIRSVGPFPGFDPAEGSGAIGFAKKDGRDASGGDGRIDVATMKSDLASGGVRAILGFWTGRRAESLRPAWITDPAGLDRIRYRPDAHPSLVTYLVRRLRQDPEGTYGIVVGPHDRDAIDLLAAEEQLDLARVKVYAQEGSPVDVSGKEVSEIYGVPGMDRPARERWAFWTAQFAQCLRCNACREGCPLCSCVRCVADKTRPRWIDSSSTPAGNWVWNVTRAFHLAGRCVDCGGCTEACPVGIPLGALNLHMKRAAEKAFGPPQPSEKGRRSPLVTFRIDDEAPFIL
jgi:F420-non-reducing hydrogenase iron-sulfur subunit